MASICLFWCIWEEHNRRMFQEEEMSDTSLRNLFLRSLLEWSQQIMDLDYLSFLNLLGDWSVGYLCPFQVFSLLCCLGLGFLCILPVYIGSASCFGVFKFNFVFLPIKKKKFTCVILTYVPKYLFVEDTFVFGGTLEYAFNILDMKNRITCVRKLHHSQIPKISKTDFQQFTSWY